MQDNENKNVLQAVNQQVTTNTLGDSKAEETTGIYPYVASKHHQENKNSQDLRRRITIDNKTREEFRRQMQQDPEHDRLKKKKHKSQKKSNRDPRKQIGKHLANTIATSTTSEDCERLKRGETINPPSENDAETQFRIWENKEKLGEKIRQRKCPELNPNLKRTKVWYRVPALKELCYGVHYTWPSAFYVYDVDLEYLQQVTPRHINHTNLHSYEKLVTSHYYVELARLRSTPKEYAEREAGLLNWPFNGYKDKIKNQVPVKRAHSKILEKSRESSKALEKETKYYTLTDFLTTILKILLFLIMGVPAAIVAAHVAGLVTAVTIGMALGAITSFLGPILGYLKWLLVLTGLYMLGKMALLDKVRYISSPRRWRGTFALVANFPVASAIGEEIFKILPGGWYLLGVLEYWIYGTWAPYYFHRRTKDLPFSHRLALHIQHNIGAKSGPLRERHEEFVREGGKWTSQEWASEETGHWYPGRKQCYGPQVGTGDLPTFDYPLGTPDPQPEKTPVGVYCVMGAASTRVMVENTSANLLGAAKARITHISNGSTDPYEQNGLTTITRHLILSLSPKQGDNEYFAEKMNAVQKKRRLEALEAFLLDKQAIDIQMFLKREFINDNGEKYVPRMIANVTQEFLSKPNKDGICLGASILALQEAFAERYDGKGEPYLVHIPGANMRNHLQVNIMYVCGQNTQDIEGFLNRAEQSESDSLWVVALGDDSLCLLRLDGRTYWLENDFSRFDRTINKFFLGLNAMALGIHQGAYAEEAYLDLYKVPITVKVPATSGGINDNTLAVMMLKSGLKEACGNMRLSGEQGTSIMNTLVNITCAINATITAIKNQCIWEEDICATTFEYAFRRYGLQPKVKLYSPHVATLFYPNPSFRDLPPMTFLKHVLLRSKNGGITMFRMPSMITTLGWTKTSPLVSDRRPISDQQKFVDFLWAQWKGFGDLAGQCDSYRKIHDWLLSLNPTNSVDEIGLEKWQVKTKATPVRETDVWALLQERYGIDVVSWFSFLKNYTSTKVFPTLYSDPVVDQLVRTDY